jgi:hypothetical protein
MLGHDGIVLGNPTFRACCSFSSAVNTWSTSDTCCFSAAWSSCRKHLILAAEASISDCTRWRFCSCVSWSWVNNCSDYDSQLLAQLFHFGPMSLLHFRNSIFQLTISSLTLSNSDANLVPSSDRSSFKANKELDFTSLSPPHLFQRATSSPLRAIAPTTKR